jgi:mannosyl-oligosaccharide alpha-1,2-mannosidase
LSAYELNGRKDKVLLEKAQQIANKLSLAWVGNNKIPYGELNYTINQPVIDSVSFSAAQFVISAF